MRAADTFQISQGSLPDGFHFGYKPVMYQLPGYLKAQPTLPDFNYWLTLPSVSKICGSICFYRSDKKAISQQYAPFGGFDGIQVNTEIANDFIEFILESLNDQGVEEIEIISPAGAYRPHVAWEQVYNHHGFSKKQAVNHHLELDQIPLDRKMHKMEQRKLARSKQFDFDVHSIGKLEEIFDFIQACRKEKGQQLSMNFAQLSLVANQLPDRFVLVSASVDRQIAAAAIVLKVNSNCWYQFYPAHSLRFNRESPMVFLLTRLYQLALNQGAKVLDLGTSQLNGRPLEGLLAFKERVGGVISYRDTYSKVISAH